MTKKEANEALNAGTPVRHNGIEYKRINAIIWRIKRSENGDIVGKLIEAELQDKSANSVIITNIENVEAVV